MLFFKDNRKQQGVISAFIHGALDSRSRGTFDKKPSSHLRTLSNLRSPASCRCLSETLQSFEWWDQIPAVIKSLFSPSLSNFLRGSNAVCIYRLPAVHRIGWCGLNSASWACKETFMFSKGTSSGTRPGFAHAKLRLPLAPSGTAQPAVTQDAYASEKEENLLAEPSKPESHFFPRFVAVFLIRPLHNVLAISSPGLCEVDVQNRRVKIISLQGLPFH